MVNRKRVLLLALAVVGLTSTSFIRADYKNPIYKAPGVAVSNLVVNYWSDGSVNSNGSVVKIKDGCRVLYYSNAYLDTNHQLNVSQRATTLVVSDIECKQDLK